MRALYVLLGTLLTTPVASARNIEQIGSGSPGIDEMWADIMSLFPYTNVGEDGIGVLLLKIVDIILKMIGGLAIAMIIYAGIRIMTGGDDGLGEAKKILMYSVIGLIAAMCADAIVIYVGIVVSGIAG